MFPLSNGNPCPTIIVAFDLGFGINQPFSINPSFVWNEMFSYFILKSSGVVVDMYFGGFMYIRKINRGKIIMNAKIYRNIFMIPSMRCVVFLEL